MKPRCGARTSVARNGSQRNVRAADWVLTPAERDEIEALTRRVDSAGQAESHGSA
jgi:hypothetical protein